MSRRARTLAPHRPVTTALVAAILVLGGAGSASAQGLFDFLFGGMRRVLPPSVPAYAPHDGTPSQSAPRGGPGSGTAYCVRTCDGRFFPIPSQRNVSAVETCKSFCPASETKVFYGRGIEHARDAKGISYASLGNAFAYRERLVEGCTCNGRTPGGLARIPVDQDPTLRRGDIVATATGLVAYNGKRADLQQAYTPVADARLPASLRRSLTDIEVSAHGPGWYEALAVPLPKPRPAGIPAAAPDPIDDKLPASATLSPASVPRG